MGSGVLTLTKETVYIQLKHVRNEHVFVSVTYENL